MKCGLKTFPLSVDLDDGIKLVEAEFGLKGYATVIKLFQAIHSRGYYMKWDIDTQLLFVRDYCLSEAGRGLVSEVVACCVRRGVFDSSLYKRYCILTSKRIQETFLNATKRSQEVIFEKEYALPVVYEFIENVNKSGKNVNISFKNADIFEQRKEKERKEEKKKEKEIVYAASRFHPPTAEEVQAYCLSRNNEVDAQRFVDYYTANGWKVGRNPMRDWRAAVRTWERGDNGGVGKRSDDQLRYLKELYDEADEGDDNAEENGD